MDQTTPDQRREFPIRCPVCAVVMVSEGDHSLQLDRCPQCRGLWFDRAELDEYIKRQGRPRTDPLRDLERLPDAGHLLCPRCAKPTLEPWRAASVLLSRCRQCRGVYLEGADLSALSGRRPVYQVPAPTTDTSGRLSKVGEISVEAAFEVVASALVEWT
jgi:uncharacterized protein